MTSLSEYIAEGFREVQSQQVIDLDKVGSVKPQNIPAALPSMYAFLYKLSDYYNGPTEYYADDETLDFYEKYFEKNPEKKQKMLDRAKKKDELSEKKFSKIPDDYIRLKAIQVRLE